MCLYWCVLDIASLFFSEINFSSWLQSHVCTAYLFGKWTHTNIMVYQLVMHYGVCGSIADFHDCCHMIHCSFLIRALILWMRSSMCDVDGWPDRLSSITFVLPVFKAFYPHIHHLLIQYAWSILCQCSGMDFPMPDSLWLQKALYSVPCSLVSIFSNIVTLYHLTEQWNTAHG